MLKLFRITTFMMCLMITLRCEEQDTFFGSYIRIVEEVEPCYNLCSWWNNVHHSIGNIGCQRVPSIVSCLLGSSDTWCKIYWDSSGWTSHNQMGSKKDAILGVWNLKSVYTVYIPVFTLWISVYLLHVLHKVPSVCLHRNSNHVYNSIKILILYNKYIFLNVRMKCLFINPMRLPILQPFDYGILLTLVYWL